MKRFWTGFVLALLLGVAVGVFYAWSEGVPNQPMAPADNAEAEVEIIATLERQNDAWNRGDIDGFMQGYVKSEALRFASGGSVNRGWDVTRDGYKARYPTQVEMGVLTFSDFEIDILSRRHALVFGRWVLERDNDRPNGLFTLHMMQDGSGWKIKSDHTSSAPP